MGNFPILTLMLLVPLIAAIACIYMDARAARATALVATLANLALGVVLWANFDIGGAQWQFTERVEPGLHLEHLRRSAGLALATHECQRSSPRTCSSPQPA